MNNHKIYTQNIKKELIFTDRTNFTYGGEIPQKISNHLINNQSSRNDFCKLSSKDKNAFLEHCKNISVQNEVKEYVQTMGESKISHAQLDYGRF